MQNLPNRNKKQHSSTLLKYAIALILTGASLTSIALPAPEYLSVKGFKSCFETVQHDTWTSWCIPHSKPDTCTSEDWDRLRKMDNPLCPNTSYSEENNQPKESTEQSESDYDDK